MGFVYEILKQKNTTTILPASTKIIYLAVTPINHHQKRLREGLGPVLDSEAGMA